MTVAHYMLCTARRVLDGLTVNVKSA